MTEVEVLILEIDKDALTEKLIALGAKKVFEGEVEPIYFDFEDQRLKKEDKIFRLRRKGDGYEVTLKKKLTKEPAKIREEFESLVSDHEAMKRILKELGLVPIKQFKKFRTSYRLDRVIFEIEEFDGAPPCVEIEATNMEDLEWGVEVIGYTMDDARSWSWREFMEHYGIENGV